MNLQEFHDSKCEQFIHREMNLITNHYDKPVLVTRADVIQHLCRNALLASQSDRDECDDTDRNILGSVTSTLRAYSEYNLTPKIEKRLEALTGFTQIDWSSLLKA